MVARLFISQIASPQEQVVDDVRGEETVADDTVDQSVSVGRRLAVGDPILGGNVGDVDGGVPTVVAIVQPCSQTPVTRRQANSMASSLK